MGLVDLFRPKYRHSDVRVRIEAVRALTSDDAEILATVARTDKDASVRRVAIEKLDEVEVLAELAKKETDNALRGLAGSRAAAIWVTSACQDEDEQLAETALQGLLELGDQKALAEVATRAAVKAVRQQAMDELKDPRALAELARATSSPEVRQTAVARIDDADTLRALAVDATMKELGLLAVEKIGAKDTLEQLAQKAKNKAVRQRARKKLDDILEAEEAQRPRESDDVRRRRAEKSQLVREVEGVAEVFEWEKSLVTVQKAEAAWAQLVAAGDTGDAALDDRFTKAVSRYHARREAAMKQVAEHKDAASAPVRMAAAPAERPERERPRRDRDEEDGDVVNQAALAAMRAQAGGPDDPKRAAREREAAERRKEREARDAQRAEEATRRDREIADRASSKQDTAERAAQIAQSLEALVDEMASLLDAPDARAIDRLLEQARTAFAQLGRVAPDARARLEARYDEVRGKLVVRANELREAEDWKRFANVPKAESLIAMAKELAELEAPRLDVLKELQKQWKAVGPIPGKKSKELWEQFKALTDAAYAKIKATRDVESAKHAEAAKVKEALCAEAEALAESTDWEATAQALKVLQQKWKESGHVPRKQGDELWKRFRAACDRFFERRKPMLDEQLAELKQNAAAKEALIAKAEAVVAKAPGEAGWGKAIAEIKSLTAQWKEIGRVPRADVEPLWQRFRAACDALFAKRDAARDAEADARRAEVEALRADIEAVVAGGEDVGARALAVRKRVDELSERGDALGGEVGALYEAMLKKVMTEHGAELKGSDLDPVAMANKRAKLVARVEALQPKDEPVVSAAASPEEIAAQLKNAMQKNALFKGDGRDPYEVVEELRAEWAAVGPVVGDEAEAQARRFEELCLQVAGPARARPERSEREERGERGGRGERGERGGRRERRDRRERRSDAGAHVPTAKPDTITSRVPVVAAPDDATTRVELEPPAVAGVPEAVADTPAPSVPEIVEEPAARSVRASTVVESPPPAPPHMILADEPPVAAAPEPVVHTKTEPVAVPPPPSVPAAAPPPAPAASAAPEPVVHTKTEPVVVAPPPPPAPPPPVVVSEARTEAKDAPPAEAPAPEAQPPAPPPTDVVDEGWD